MRGAEVSPGWLALFGSCLHGRFQGPTLDLTTAVLYGWQQGIVLWWDHLMYLDLRMIFPWSATEAEGDDDVVILKRSDSAEGP